MNAFMLDIFLCLLHCLLANSNDIMCDVFECIYHHLAMIFIYGFLLASDAISLALTEMDFYWKIFHMISLWMCPWGWQLGDYVDKIKQVDLLCIQFDSS